MIPRTCDVLVAGGGPAGLAAAIAAARSGAHTVLIERYGFLGGMATAGLAGSVCGLYLRRSEEPARFVSGGFIREWAARLARASRSQPKAISEGLHVLPCDPWSFARLADEMTGETPGLERVLHGTLAAVQVQEKHLVEVHALVWDRLVAWLPRFVVDCTGEATMAHLAGGPTDEDPGHSAPAIVFALDDVDPNVHTHAGGISVLLAIGRAIQEGHLSAACDPVSLIPSAYPEARLYLKVSLPSHPDTVIDKMTKLEVEARNRVDELSRFLLAEVPAFARARLSRTAAQVGLRIGRRVKGRAQLTEADVLACRKFTDGIARGAWPMEEWGETRRPRITLFPEGDYYEIPVGCLLAEGLENVLVAGRCLSATPEAMASARVIGTALGTGWAAGLIAAYQATGHSQAQAVADIRKDMEG